MPLALPTSLPALQSQLANPSLANSPSPALQSQLANPSLANPPRGVEWLTLEEAAARGGYASVGSLRHRLKEWIPSGLARQVRPGKGKPLWQVRSDADERFARVKFPEQLCDLSAFTQAQRDKALARKAILDQWQAALAKSVALTRLSCQEATRQFCQLLGQVDGQRVSRATLYGWRSAYRAQGLAGLVDERGAKPKPALESDEDDPFFAEVRRLYLDQRKISLNICHRIAEQKALENHWPVRSYKACQRMIKKLPHAVKIRYREGEKAFEDQCEPAIGRDYSSIAANAIWCGDDHKFDVKVAVPGEGGEVQYVRPTISAWEDVRSRKIVGWCITAGDGNTDTILKAFVMGAQSHGLPAKVMIDNGKTYDSRTLQGESKMERRARMKSGARFDKARMGGVFGLLDVAVQHVWIYHGQSKPIERQFGTVCAQFSRLCDTYCGNKPGNRPEDHEDRLHLAPTLAQFTEKFAAWLEGWYHAEPHRGHAMDGRSPSQAFEQELAVKRLVPADVLHFAALPRFGPKIVRKQGVTYQGLCFGGFTPEVQKLQRQKVFIAVDNDDLSRVFVISLEGKLLCAAPLNRRLGFNASSADLRESIKEKRAHHKTIKAYHKARPRMAIVSDPHEALARSAARRAQARAQENPQPAPAAPSLQPHRTGFEAQADTIRAIVQKPLRAAVGAESFTSQSQLANQQSPIPEPDTRFRYTPSEGSEDPEDPAPRFMRLTPSLTSEDQ